MTTDTPGPAGPGDGRLNVVFLNWRDTRNPEGGGSERYVESVARGLASAGHSVTILCAAHRNAPADEDLGGVRIVRRGGKLTVYPRALAQLWTRRGDVDVVVDVQNGVPFFSRLVTRRPVVVLVHHVHREQWPVVYGPTVSRFGWWVESRLAPWLYRRSQYVAVSEVTRRELGSLGVGRDRVAVVHNGTDRPLTTAPRAASPTLCVLSRLVPHKRIEQALTVTARLRGEVPGLQLLVIGDGWWSDRLAVEADRLGVTDITRFVGFVDESEKHRLLATSWVHLAPSLKEGWGLTVMEAAAHGVPTVAYRQAGGLSESVVDGITGHLVDDEQGLTMAVRHLLDDELARRRMGEAARRRALGFRWERSAAAFEQVLVSVARGDRVADVDRTGTVREAPDLVDLTGTGDLTGSAGDSAAALHHQR